MRRVLRFTVWLLIILLLSAGLASAQSLAPPGATVWGEPAPNGVGPDALLQTLPTQYMTGARSVALGGGFVYWQMDCVGQVDRGPVYIKRQSANDWRLPVQTVLDIEHAADHAQCLSVTRVNVADDDGYFYVATPRLEARLTHDPTVAIHLANGVNHDSAILATDDSFVYYNRHDGSGIYRAGKTAFGGTRISDATGVTGLAVDDTYIYWLDAGGLWRSNKTCTAPSCWNNKEHLSPAGGRHLTWMNPGELLWTSKVGTNWQVMTRNQFGGTTSRYSVPDTMTYGLGPAVHHDGCFFWLENTLHSKIIPSYNLIRRRCGGGSAETIQERTGLVFADELRLNIEARTHRLLFLEGAVGWELRLDAEAIVKDFSVTGIEVTQAIQNLQNDVELVAQKPTYVRVFGRLQATSPANSVQAWLRGYVAGTTEQLPGSPLMPVHPPRALMPQVAPNRVDPDDAWLFQLPESWTQEGDITLEVEIDPWRMYTDPDRDDNRMVATVQFHRKAPICLHFIPIRTEAGRGLRDYGAMVDLARRMMPVNQIRTSWSDSPVEKLGVCWAWIVPYPCYKNYRLWDTSFIADRILVLNSIVVRRAFTNTSCDSYDGRSHYVGLAHPASSTNGVRGSAYFDSVASWVRQTSPEADASRRSWQRPYSGVTLAHELGHNLNRKHVGCGGPDQVDGSWPYSYEHFDNCVLHDGHVNDPGTYFGFDVGSLTPIPPRMRVPIPNTLNAFWYLGDLMSYASFRWPSDYTWRAYFQKMPRGPASAQMSGLPDSVAPAERALEASLLSAGDTVVVISGVVAPTLPDGVLSYAWTYPPDSLNAQILGQLQTFAVSRLPALHSSATAGTVLRLRDANGAVIADYLVELETFMDDDSDVEHASFVSSFPAPAAQVARIELLIDGTVVDTLNPGSAQPSVEILQPAGGETFVDGMTIVWQATDPDPDDTLLYSVQYSADLGQTWEMLVTDWPGLPDSDTVMMTLESLVGSGGSSPNGALVRVHASDGYNTATVTSNPFTVANQPPLPFLIAPEPGEAFAAGAPILLRGGADDAEDGTLTGASLTWDVTGLAPRFGEEVFVQGLAPGTYDVTLTAEDSAGLTSEAHTSMTVSPLRVPTRASSVAEPELDGFCDDEAYADAAVVGLRPYPDGSQGVIRMVRTSEHLWACFSGLQRGSESDDQLPMNTAGVLVDVNHSRESTAQADDLWLFVQETGMPGIWSGPVWAPIGSVPTGLQARISGDETHWNAELRIEANIIGGWGHTVGLELLHVWVPESGGGHWQWPYQASTTNPASWATTVLGTMPQATSLSVDEAVKGTPLTIFIEGSGFQNGAVVLWNGTQKATTFFGHMLLSFQVNASDLNQAGTVEVRVRNPGLAAAPSNALTFTVTNPVPRIISITPDSIEAGGNAITIEIAGEGFDPASLIMWDGEAKSTSWGSGTHVSFVLSRDDRAASQEVDVVVLTPGPGGGASNVVTFTLTAPPNQPPGAPFNPMPADMAADVPTDQTLSWQAEDPDGQPLRYDVHFGADNPPPLVASGIADAGYAPEGLSTGTTYYWRIVATDGMDTTMGPLWSFTTAATPAPNRPPHVPSAPNPSHGLTDVPVRPVLSWRGGDPDGDAVVYTVRLGITDRPPVVADRLSTPSFRPPEDLQPGTTYYWQITSSDRTSTTDGPIWSFTTLPLNRAPNPPFRPTPRDDEIGVGLNPLLSWQGSDPDGDALTYDIAIGTRFPLPVVATGLRNAQYQASGLSSGTRYYWRVLASDGTLTTPGPLWSFTTIRPNRPPNPPFDPRPGPGATRVPRDQHLSWSASDPDGDRLTYKVAFGRGEPLPIVADNLTTATYDPGPLNVNATYRWRIIVSDGTRETVGPTWTFETVRQNRPPHAPYLPYPIDKATEVPLDQVLTWSGYDPDRDPLTYSVYFGESDPPPLVSEDLTTTFYLPSVLDPGKQYYWRISAGDGRSTTMGPIWRFRTGGYARIYLPLTLRQD